MAVNQVFDKKNSLVTGGAGFLGSHLCESLLQEGRVICVDDLSTGVTGNIEHLLANPDFVFIKHDITEPLDLEQLPEMDRFKIKFQGLQEIYHLACPMSVARYESMRTAVLRANSLGTMNTLDWAVKYKARYLLASSASIYGPRQNDKPVTEDTMGLLDHLSVRGAYDEGKRFAETIVATYSQMQNVDGRIARLFRTYGPRLPLFDGQMLTDFVLNAIDKKELVINGSRDFHTSLLYISDAVSAILKLMKAPTGLGPVNIGGDQEVLIKDVAEQVIKMTGSTSTVNFSSPLTFLSEQPLPDISVARNQLGWMPLVRLADGLQHLVDYTIANRHRLGA